MQTFSSSTGQEKRQVFATTKHKNQPWEHLMSATDSTHLEEERLEEFIKNIYLNSKKCLNNFWAKHSQPVLLWGSVSTLFHKIRIETYKRCFWDSNSGSILVEISKSWAPKGNSANLSFRDSDASSSTLWICNQKPRNQTLIPPACKWESDYIRNVFLSPKILFMCEIANSDTGMLPTWQDL